MKYLKNIRSDRIRSVTTCLGIHVEIRAVRLQHVEGQFSLRGGVRICGRHLSNGADAVHVLRHRRKVDRQGKLWSVVVDVQDLQEDVGPRQQRLRSQISDEDSQPVVRPLLTVQNL